MIPRLGEESPGWLPDDSHPLLFGRLQVSLNLPGRAFPARMTEAARLALRDELTSTLWPQGLPPRHGLLARLGGEHWEFLSERWLQEPADWGHGEALLVVEEGEGRDEMLVGEDHLRLGLRARPEELEEAARDLDVRCRSLEAGAGLAEDEEGRRLVANPFLCGSGCHGSLVLHLPALAWWGQVEEQLDPLYECGLSYRTWQEGFGDYVVLENVRGDAWPDGEASPDEGPVLLTLRRLLEAARRLEEAERSARSQLKRHRRLEVEDRVLRALALCRAARLMGYPELVEQLSLLRLGRQLKEAGWELPALPGPFTRLLLSLAPAHLAFRGDAGRDGRQASALRARLLRAALD